MLRQKSVNYDKFGKEQRKLQQNSMYCVWLGDILHITHMINVDKCQISLHLSCGDIWTFSAWQMQRNFRFPHICYVKQSKISPHAIFSTGTIYGTRDKYQGWWCHLHRMQCWQKVLIVIAVAKNSTNIWIFRFLHFWRTEIWTHITVTRHTWIW